MNELLLTGVVGGEIRSDELSKQLSPGLVIQINSEGGDAFEGIAIYNILRKRGNIDVEIIGIAASAASIIAMGGRKVSMAKTGFLMIHNPFVGAAGDAKKMRKTADSLQAVEEQLANIYAERTGLEQSKILDMMDEETWLTAEKALELGFIDAILDQEAVYNSAIASMSYKNIPSDCLYSDQPFERDKAESLPESLQKYQSLKDRNLFAYKVDGKVNVNGAYLAMLNLETTTADSLGVSEEDYQAAIAEVKEIVEDWVKRNKAQALARAKKIKVTDGKNVYLISKKDTEMLETIKAHLKVADEAEAFEVIKGFQAKIETLKTEKAELEAKISEDAKANTEIKAELAKMQTAHTLLTEQIEAINAERKENELAKISAEVEQLKKDGYLSAAMGESLVEAYQEQGLKSYEFSRDLVKAAGPQKKHLLENQGSANDAPDEITDPVQAFEAKIKEVMDAEKLDYQAAVKKIGVEQPDLFTAYNNAVTGLE